MRKTVYVCDACGKELDPEKGVWKATLCTRGSSEGDEIGKELLEKEFCAACIARVTKILGVKAAPTRKGTGRKKTKAAILEKATGKAAAAEETKIEAKKEAKIEAKNAGEAKKAEVEAKTLVSQKKQGSTQPKHAEELSPENAVLLEQEIRFFLENGQKKQDIIPELMHSYRVSEETVKEMIAQYEELSGKETGKLMDRK